MVTMPNHPNKPEMGRRDVPFSGEIWIDRADFREEANKQYKRLVLGKEVRLRNAYVIKAERVEKDEEGNITTIFCYLRCGNAEQRSCRWPQGERRDPLGVGDPTRCRRKSVCTIVCSACLTRARRRTSSPPSTRNRW